MPAYGSPGHIGVRPVLLRLLAPRHPPCALDNFSSVAPVKSDFLALFPYPVFKVHQRGIPSKPKSERNDPVVYGSFLYPKILRRKEVIHPHLPVGIPCYDFTPIICPTFGGWIPKVSSPTSGVADSRGVTGGVYKARERIHRGMLIRDY